MRQILFLFCSLGLLGCRPSSPPAGDYAGRWLEPDGSTVEMKLVLSSDGKATMQRTIRWPDGHTEADSWESEYRVTQDRLLIGSEGKVYALFRRQGDSLLDPSHPIQGKPIRLRKTTRAR
ncbi:MAG: hypothetical protein AB7T14_07800 [Candidatus Methylacidiphilaceae bacterium]